MTIFADTFYFIGLLNRRDQNHSRCTAFARTFQGLAVTTDYVLIELADALSSPATRGQAIEFIAQVRANSQFRIVSASEDLLQRGFELYRSARTRTGLSPTASHLS